MVDLTNFWGTLTKKSSTDRQLLSTFSFPVHNFLISAENPTCTFCEKKVGVLGPALPEFATNVSTAHQLIINKIYEPRNYRSLANHRVMQMMIYFG